MKCAQCGKEFEPAKRRPNQKYCSEQCRGKAHWARKKLLNPHSPKPKKCVYCGKEFEPYRSYQKYCSHKCKDESNYRLNHEKILERAKAYYAEHCEELRAKQKIYYITGKWPKGKLT